jgi:hypothetical protein
LGAIRIGRAIDFFIAFVAEPIANKGNAEKKEYAYELEVAKHNQIRCNGFLYWIEPY